VLEHSVTTHESVEQYCPDCPPVHVIEYHERIIESMEDAGQLIAELDKQIAELTEIKSKYDAIMEQEQAKALAEKQEKAKAFAEKQGLNVQETAVAEAIKALDYGKIAELTMAIAEKQEPEQKEEVPAISLASFVDLEISEDKYGGLLSRRNK
jgi:type I site-specific restriction-modification system R (restriction) subunit